MVERERSLEESKEAIEAKLLEVYSEKDHVSFALDQTLKKLQLELEEISSVRISLVFYSLYHDILIATSSNCLEIFSIILLFKLHLLLKLDSAAHLLSTLILLR